MRTKRLYLDNLLWGHKNKPTLALGKSAGKKARELKLKLKHMISNRNWFWFCI